MNYSFSDRMRLVLARSRDEALALGHNYVGTEHMLLGLVREPEGPVSAILASAGATEEGVRRAVERRVRRGRGQIGRAELPYTSRAKKVLELAMKAARERGDAFVGTEHLLSGLAREEKGIAANVLVELGLSADAIDAAVAAARNGEVLPRPVAARMASASRPVWFLEVDADAAMPIYEQIVARVEEAVATGRLEAGERLPTVRQLAEELAVAPGTVARAYTELERRGVIETAGARGTHVAQRAGPGGADDGGNDEELEGLLRPAAIAAFHMGATAEQLRRALDRAMRGILKSIVLP